MYYIYILISDISHKFYLGYSDDPFRRVEEHNSKPFKTFTSKYRPWTLGAVFQIGPQKTDAIQIERFLKGQHSARLIQKLLDPCFVPDGKLAQLVRVTHVRD